ncbi:ABC transporter permease [Fodinicola acaciae]|uniref:ABC transporter permease n=1 Tax=Fodinicola acaciae TaxID=2681555 RepID=UPI001C9E278B|nr:ABC transporter permease [Fodinicola acaciae]
MTTLTSASKIARLRLPTVGDPAMPLIAGVCVLLVLFAVVGPLLTAWEPSALDPASANVGPSANHWLGTDYLGRDLYSRAAYGARISLLGAALVVAVTTIFAVATALSAAWFGGWVDTVLSRAMDILFAFPSLLFALIAVAVFGTGLTAPVIALAIAYLPYLGRVMRTVALRERNMAYIEACALAGIPTWRIWLRHLLPALLPYLRAQATIAFGYAIADLAAISFIGLGVQAPIADWGVMVAEGREPLLSRYPLESVVAGLLIVVTVVAFNLLGERLSARAEAQ